MRRLQRKRDAKQANQNRPNGWREYSFCFLYPRKAKSRVALLRRLRGVSRPEPVCA